MSCRWAVRDESATRQAQAFVTEDQGQTRRCRHSGSELYIYIASRFVTESARHVGETLAQESTRHLAVDEQHPARPWAVPVQKVRSNTSADTPQHRSTSGGLNASPVG
jgi:hypothetical protein